MENLDAYTKIKYRKLGGWLMFLFVWAIICACSNGLSLANSLISVISLAVSGAMREMVALTNTIHVTYIWVGMLVSGLVTYILSVTCHICSAVFLKKRQFKRFRFFLLGELCVMILGQVATMVWLILIPVDFGKYISLLGSGYSYPPTGFIDVFNSFMGMMFSVMLGIFIFYILVFVGLLITWMQYLKRSKRVAVYFDEDYVEPPLPAVVYPPYPYYAQGYYQPQAYPYQPGAYGPGYPPPRPPAYGPAPYAPEPAAQAPAQGADAPMADTPEKDKQQPGEAATVANSDGVQEDATDPGER